MNETNDIYTRISSEKDDLNARSTIVDFLKEEVKHLDPDSFYTIAGLLSTDFAQKLPNNDPLEEILTLAGELEVSSDQTAEKINLLTSLINKLES